MTVPRVPGGRPDLLAHLCMVPTSQVAKGPAQAHSIASAIEYILIHNLISNICQIMRS